jgi:olfactory receptor
LRNMEIKNCMAKLWCKMFTKDIKRDSHHWMCYYC